MQILSMTLTHKMICCFILNVLVCLMLPEADWFCSDICISGTSSQRKTFFKSKSRICSSVRCQARMFGNTCSSLARCSPVGISTRPRGMLNLVIFAVPEPEVVTV
ncbi:hypothetical protein DFJ58DRAFT_795481 [Suillus subalutaceus]|uniref:uncharacterized protein n=1 Tax=Suillus subalutaceus TaxID=48586 RepID=UPI001B87B262|nr:uncharacterized protein DFJ58DRAFT_795481 [Suillus subalutaceus]KAG1849185.1 hypothetical protein DFJ58DRAFT_795481 [Suillus subalutaceus]